MKPANDSATDQTKDFEPTNLLRIYDSLSYDHERLVLEKTTWVLDDLLGEDFEAIQSTYDRAYDSLIDFEDDYGIFQERWEKGELDEAALRAVFPPGCRPELESRVRGIIEALRAYRDAAIAAVRQRLSRTAVNSSQLSSVPSPSTLQEVGNKLAADYENLSQAVSHLALFYKDRSPSIKELWDRAEAQYAETRDRLETFRSRTSAPPGESTESTPGGDNPSTMLEEVVTRLAIQTTTAQLGEVRHWLQSAVAEDLAWRGSLENYDPDWASPGSPIFLSLKSQPKETPGV